MYFLWYKLGKFVEINYCVFIKPFMLQWSHHRAQQYGQYLTHAPNHITRAVATMDTTVSVLLGLCDYASSAWQSLQAPVRSESRFAGALNCRGYVSDSAMPMRPKKTDTVVQANVGVIWLYACVRYWPYRAEMYCVAIAV